MCRGLGLLADVYAGSGGNPLGDRGSADSSGASVRSAACWAPAASRGGARASIAQRANA